MDAPVLHAVEHEHGTDIYLNGKLYYQSAPNGEVYWKALLTHMGYTVITHMQDESSMENGTRLFLSAIENLAPGKKYGE